MLANYHTHTVRCGHARGADREYIEHAIQNGMRVLGMSDHCPWIFPDDYVSGTRMRPGELDGYFTSMTKLRDEYAGDITLYIGFESEYIPELIEAQDRLLSDYPVDYMILGQHFTRREPVGPYTGFPVYDESFLTEYIDSVIAGMETGRYKYVAHPDLMPFAGPQEIGDREYLRLCRYLASHGIPVEINLLGVVEGRHYTGNHFLDLAAQAGCSAIIGCDAHQPERLSMREGHERCAAMAAAHGLVLTDYLPGLEPRL